jgi:transcription initiation factor TFIID subunit 6
MRHGKRTTLTTSDVDQALRVLNIEPLYGHTSHNPPSFRRALPFPQMPTAGTVYFVEDEEIDFDRVLREEKITLPKGVTWTTHWLAVEGVQPLIPENPPAIPKEPEQDATKPPEKTNSIFPPTPPSPGRPSAAQNTKMQQQNQQLVKQVLSRELQLYYSRLTSSLLPATASDTTDQAKRTAALASLRSDAGLQALLPYLIRWVGEGVVGTLKEGEQRESDGRAMDVFLEVLSAILDNKTLFVEPYVSSAPLYRVYLNSHFSHPSYTKYSPRCYLPFFIRPYPQHTRPIFVNLRLRHCLAFSPNIPRRIPHFLHVL